MQCSHCGTQLFERAKFCWECGRALTLAVDRGPDSSPAGRDRERRSITVLFCDLVGSTRIAQRVDPEELHDIISRYQSHCVEVLVRHQGHVAQFLGDGVLVYFGYPMAQEDAALRAARAGIEIIDGLDKLNRLLLRHYELRVAVRIGIHRGVVVIGEIGSGNKREVLAVGETTNIAAKLQASAAPNSVVVSADVQRLIRHELLTVPCGEQAVADGERPVSAYRVVGALHHVESSPRLVPALVARREETLELEQLLERSALGVGEAALLVGAPGIGKSRLLGWLHQRVLQSDRAWLEFRCSAYERHTPLAPLITLQRECFGFLRSDAAEERSRKLAAALGQVGLWSPLAESLLGKLHALEPTAPLELAELSPDLQRRRTLELCSNWLLSLARKAGLVLVIDDLHWVDPTTDEFFELLLQKIADRRVLIVGACRPEYEASMWSRPNVRRLELGRLVASEVYEIVRRLAAELPERVINRIVERSDGVPLFAEEMSLAALESEDPTNDQVTPPTLQDLLQSRLDRLGSAKALAQLCAVIGAETPDWLIERVLGPEHPELEAHFDALVRAQLMTRSSTADGPSYAFRHTLVRDTAYDGLLRSQRREYHGRVAEALREQPDLVEQKPELLAYHLARSERPDQSVSYWIRAGQLGLQRSSNREAIEHFSNGLAGLEALPLEPTRLGLELHLRTLLGVSAMAAFGYANEVVQRHHSRAAELCEILRAPAQTFPVSFGLWLVALVRADRRTALQLAEGLLDTAERTLDRGFAVQAELAATLTRYWSGDFASALAHAERTIELYDEAAHGGHALQYGDDPRVYGYVYRGMAQYFLGFPDQARESLRSARRHAAVHPPFTRVGAAAFETQLINLTGDSASLAPAAQRTLLDSSEQGFPLFVAVGAVHAGWARVQAGDAGGLAQMETGIADFVTTGAQLNLPYFESQAARARVALGAPAEALKRLDAALLRTDTSIDTYYVPELLRAKAELELTLQPGCEAGRAGLLSALERARAQGSRALELRVLSSSLQMAQSPEAARAARENLERVYASYTEGWDTADLRHARRLLGSGD
jgi:class 3 adenylate cyclase